MGKFVDLTGKRFGRLVVVRRVERKYNQVMWLCKCDCGNQKDICAYSLNHGLSTSCGCWGREQRVKSLTKHDKCKTRLYRIWSKMKERCYNPNTTRYFSWGGRGIKVCDEWLDKENGFINFYNWAMANGYKEGLSIDRIDNNGNYEPSNCKWSTAREQSNNTRRNVVIEYKNKSQTLSEWVKELNLPYDAIQCRFKRGWSAERAFIEPIRISNRNKGV